MCINETSLPGRHFVTFALTTYPSTVSFTLRPFARVKYQAVAYMYWDSGMSPAVLMKMSEVFLKPSIQFESCPSVDEGGPAV